MERKYNQNKSENKIRTQYGKIRYFQHIFILVTFY